MSRAPTTATGTRGGLLGDQAYEIARIVVRDRFGARTRTLTARSRKISADTIAVVTRLVREGRI